MAANLDTYDIGDDPTFTATFADSAGTATDPTAVTFMWLVPAGTETSYVYGVASEVTKSSTGVYTFSPPTISAAGRHVCRAKGTGALIAAVEGQIGVRISAFTTP